MKHSTIGIFFPRVLFIFTLYLIPVTCHSVLTTSPVVRGGCLIACVHTECCIWTFESNLIAFIMVIIICHLAVGLHNYIFWFVFFLSLFCVLLHFYDFKVILKVNLLLLGLKHLRILQLPEMSSRFVGLEHFCRCSPDESLALWPVWASYSQAKTEVYTQYINIYTHTQTHSHIQKTCIHIVRNGQKWTEGACRGEWLCFLDNINTKVLFQCPNKGTLVFSSSFLFSHIFLLSHTFVDILFCLGQMYVRDQLSVLSCLLQLSTAGNFAGFWFFSSFLSLLCRPVFSFWCLFSIYPLLINVISSLHLKLCSFLMH